MAANLNAENLVDFKLTAESFPVFYNKILTMRFPISVAEVLEYRYLLNHTGDRIQDPTDTPDYRDFKDSLLTAIHSFGIENKHHYERLLKILTMIRTLHYYHSLASRNAEVKLRSLQQENRRARAQSMRYGSIVLLLMIASTLAWISMSEPGWIIKLVTIGCAYMSWDYFHSLPILDREMDRLTLQINEVLRKRVNSLNWRTLIHKIALILGYKKIRGIEVFHSDEERINPQHPGNFH